MSQTKSKSKCCGADCAWARPVGGHISYMCHECGNPCALTSEPSAEKEAPLRSIHDTIEVKLALAIEDAGYKDHEDMDNNDFAYLLDFVQSELAAARKEGFKEGREYSQIMQKIGGFIETSEDMKRFGEIKDKYLLTEKDE